MRPSIPILSDMPGPKVYNLWWGDSTGLRQKGVVQYTLSPYQAKAAPNMIRSYLFNGYRRLGGELIFWLLPFGAGYGIYSWAKAYDHAHNSKAGHMAAAGENH